MAHVFIYGMNKGSIILILLISILLIPPPQAKSKPKIWYIGTGGDFENIMQAMGNDSVTSGDILVLISDVYDEYYGGEIDRSITIDGNGYKWTINRYVKAHQLDITNADVIIKNITIEFMGIYTKHLFMLTGPNSSLTITNTNISIARGGGIGNIITSVAYLPRKGGYSISFKNVKISTAPDLNLSHLVWGTLIDSRINISLDNIHTNIQGTLIQIQLNNSWASIYIDSLSQNPSIQLFNITSDNSFVKSFINNYTHVDSGPLITINQGSNSIIDLALKNISAKNIDGRLINIGWPANSNISIYMENIEAVDTWLLPNLIELNSSILNLRLHNMTLTRSQKNLEIMASQSQANITIRNTEWDRTSPIISISLDKSNSTIKMEGIMAPGDELKFLRVTGTNSSIEGIFRDIFVSGKRWNPIEFTLRNTTTEINLSDVLLETVVQTGFIINTNGVKGEVNIENLMINEVNRRAGIITLINSEVNVTVRGLVANGASNDGLQITSEPTSTITIENSSIINCTGWSLYIQGGVYLIKYSELDGIYVTTANVTILETRFDEVNSLIFYSNVSVEYHLLGTVRSSLFDIPLSSVYISVYDSYGEPIVSGNIIRGRFSLKLEYNINQTYRAHPLNITFNTGNFRWTNTTGPYTMERLEIAVNISAARFGIYKYIINNIFLEDTLYIETNGTHAYVTYMNATYPASVWILRNGSILYIVAQTDTETLYIIYNRDLRFGMAILPEPPRVRAISLYN